MNKIFKLTTVAAVVTLLFGSTTCFAFDQTKYHIPEHKNWMKYLRDDTPARLVSIPGAHDAASGRINVAGTSCQNMNIKDLFDAGVRYFDFRVGFTGGIRLRMYHGPIDLSRTFKGVMNDLYEKLKDNDTEFVIVEVTIESATKQQENAKHHLRSYFRHSYREEGTECRGTEYWQKESEYNAAKKMWMYFDPYATVGQLRGKVVLLFNDKYDDDLKMAGPYIPGRGDGPGNIKYIEYYKDGKLINIPLHAQNDYHEDSFDKDVTEKFYKYVKPECEMFTQYVKDNPQTPVWGMNFLSAYIDLIPNQYDIGGPVNTLFAQYVNEHPELYLGIVMMDYCGVPFYKSITSTTVNGDIALEAIINNNRRYWDMNKLKLEGRDRREPFEMDSL